MDTVPVVDPLAETRVFGPKVVWTPDRAVKPVAWTVPTLGAGLWRGLMCKCPSCGQTRLFRGYLTVVHECSNCHAPLGSVRADDAPPYFTIFAVGHIVIPGMFMTSRVYDIPDLYQGLIWLPVTALLSLGFLRPIKGATVGLMLRLGLLKAGPDA